jgi:hypothetical protein
MPGWVNRHIQSPYADPNTEFDKCGWRSGKDEDSAIAKPQFTLQNLPQIVRSQGFDDNPSTWTLHNTYQEDPWPSDDPIHEVCLCVVMILIVVSIHQPSLKR